MSADTRKMKKHGLKLDSVQEEPIQTETPARKRRKLAKDVLSKTLPKSKSSTASSPAKRKGVSFSADTKLEDGSSSMALLAAYEAKHQPESFKVPKKKKNKSTHKHRIPKTESLTRGDRQLEDENLAQPIHKTPDHEQKSRVNVDSIEHPALCYLREYHISRATWKFNKNKQTYLLKHILDLSKINSSYDDALTAYINGLQGELAKQRLRTTARDAIVADSSTDVTSDTIKDPQRAKEYYDQAIEEYKSKILNKSSLPLQSVETPEKLDSQLQLRLETRKRAEMVLHLAGEDQHTNDTTKKEIVAPRERVKLNSGGMKRRRKRRTQASDEDSSSSSESTDSDSESESNSSDSESDN